jgi:hypothetical protein
VRNRYIKLVSQSIQEVSELSHTHYVTRELVISFMGLNEEETEEEISGS